MVRTNTLIALALFIACAGCGHVEGKKEEGSSQQTTDRAQYRELRGLRQRVDGLDANVEGLTQFAEAASGGMPDVSGPSGPITLVGPLPQQQEEDAKQRRINLAIARIKARQGVCPTAEEARAPSGPSLPTAESMDSVENVTWNGVQEVELRINMEDGSVKVKTRKPK